MKPYCTLLLLLTACQASTVSEQRKVAKVAVPDDAYHASICSFSLYSGEHCASKVASNTKRETLRRVELLKALEPQYKNKLPGFKSIFYASHPSVNSDGGPVPYHLFVLSDIVPEKETGGSVYVFTHRSYDFVLLWKPDSHALSRLAKAGTPIHEFVDCSALVSNTNLNWAKYYSIVSVPCG
ncbi:hypothetical protein L4C34_15075 [Vibrio profundum]|uniref:hypothetical protein n=1 Tax=Vibrio profundum TaxID=2910247 RepID=UPI003D0EEF7C